ncbi:MAG: hypothetical protein DRH04_00270 [Deltaproteobacteria bacterium]|nr:MAG: hypothetical protein DRH04_00270 [Deltaproteobacteria bacterium]
MEELYLQIVFQSDFAIGSGFSQPGTIDNRVNRNRDDQPFLPGSSLKGILRDQARELSLLLNLTLPDPARPFDDEESPLARLFGSPWLEAGICFRTCQPEVSGLTELQRQQLTGSSWGNRIDPDLGTVMEDHLYCREIADRKLGYWLAISENTNASHALKEIDPALLVAAILRCRHLGSGKTRGRGEVRLLPTDLDNWRWEGENARQWLDNLLLLASETREGKDV